VKRATFVVDRGRGLAAAAIDGKIYVVGGAVYLTTSSLTPVDDAELYELRP
jgi:hypothetical protein